MTKRLEIIFHKDGSITSQGFEFKGPECVKKREFLDREFGNPESVEFKDSYEEIEESTKICDGLPSGYCG